jgi:hypothetical protein
MDRSPGKDKAVTATERFFEYLAESEEEEEGTLAFSHSRTDLLPHISLLLRLSPRTLQPSFLIGLAAADEDEETADALKDVVKPNNSSKLR